MTETENKMSLQEAECVIISDSWLNENRIKPIVSKKQKEGGYNKPFPS